MMVFSACSDSEHSGKSDFDSVLIVSKIPGAPVMSGEADWLLGPGELLLFLSEKSNGEEMSLLGSLVSVLR